MRIMNISVKYYFQCFSDLKISVQIIQKKKRIINLMDVDKIN